LYKGILWPKPDSFPGYRLDASILWWPVTLAFHCDRWWTLRLNK